MRVDDQFVGNGTSTYTYDSRGNITAKNVYPFTRNETITSSPTETKTFTYANFGWKDLLVAVDDVELTYDEIGNVLSFGSRAFTWNSGRNLASITDGSNTYSYKYDENGIRTSKTVNGVTTYYNTKNGVILSQSDGTNTMYFLYDTSGTPLGFILNGTQYFYMTNQMGDVICITEANGNIFCEYVYDEWGKVIAINYVDENNAQQIAVATANPLRYRGYYYDIETGYYYLQSRYYDPDICRFINADIPEIAQMSKNNSAGSNLFAYCNNEPINHVDYDGYYNRKKAVSYAKRWAYFRNPLYRTYGQDCANFVSQCLAAGGIKTNNMWHNELLYVGAGMFNRGELVYDVTNNWSTVRGLMNYFVNFQKYCAQISACYFLNRNGNANTMIKDFISFSDKIQVGDIMLMDTHIDGKEAYNHATIITKITNNEIYYTAHSKNRLDAKLSEKVSSKSIENIYVISLKNSAV
ncbi:MAG: amidase domain-containing protein [Candidatus Fimenecus sp.]